MGLGSGVEQGGVTYMNGEGRPSGQRNDTGVRLKTGPCGERSPQTGR